MNLDYENPKAEFEDALFKKFWKITGSEEFGEISMENLKTFLLGLMNYYLPKMGHSEETIGLGRVINGKYFLRQEEVLKVHKLFMQFYDNRVKMLAKVGYQKKIDKLTKMQDVFKNLKCKDTKITYSAVKGNAKSLSKVKEKISEKKRTEKLPIRSPELILSRSGNFFEDRGNSSKTPKTLRSKLILDSSFHSNRSFSRSHSRSRLVHQTSMKSINSENESKIFSTDTISDPNILLKAQDILGQFSLLSNQKKAVPEKIEENEKIEKNKKNERFGKNEKLGKTEKNEPSPVSKLVFQKKSNLKSVNSKNIDDQLKRATVLLKQTKLGDDFSNEEIIIDVNMPNGTMKTLVIPQNASRSLAVRKFVKDNKLSVEMSQTLLDSIQYS